MSTHIEQMLAEHRAKIEAALGPVRPEGDIAAAVAELRPLMEESELLQITFDPEFDLVRVEIFSPYSSHTPPAYEARSISDALRAAIAARKENR